MELNDLRPHACHAATGDLKRVTDRQLTAKLKIPKRHV